MYCVQNRTGTWCQELTKNILTTVLKKIFLSNQIIKVTETIYHNYVSRLLEISHEKVECDLQCMTVFHDNFNITDLCYFTENEYFILFNVIDPGYISIHMIKVFLSYHQQQLNTTRFLFNDYHDCVKMVMQMLVKGTYVFQSYIIDSGCSMMHDQGYTDQLEIIA